MSRLMRLMVALVVVVAGLALPSMPTAVADAAGVGGDYVPLATPFRVLNTTSGAKKGPESTTNVKVTGVGGVPANGVSAVLVDVSGEAPTAATWLALWETGKTRPQVVNVWLPAGSPGLSNTATVPVSDTGNISVWNQEGSTHIVIDIQGYFTETTGVDGRGGFVPVQQTTIVDGTRMEAKASLTVQITGSLVPTTATSVFLNVRVAATGASWINAYPAGGTMGNSIIDYDGTSSSGASVKLGTGGKVVFVNRGDAAINIFLTVQGYFSNTHGQGAGFRKGAGRLASGLTLAPNAVTDVSVGGRYGLPTRSIAGAAINFSTVNSGGSGSLRVWPLGGTEPTAHANVTTYPEDAVRGSMAIVKPGTEAKIRVRNVSQQPVQIWLDLLGWFAERLPEIPTRPNTPITVLQLPPAPGAQVGHIEYAYVDNIGRLVHGHQTDMNHFAGTIVWTTVSGNDGYTGRPALTHLQNGALQIAAQNFDSNIHALTQSTPYPTGAWGPWAELGGSMAGPPTAARLPSGTVVLFAVDADGRLWHRMANDYWRSLGDVNLVGSVTVATVDGALQLFALDTTGALRTTTYTDGTASAWSSLGGSGLTGTPAVVVYPGFKLRVFVRTATGTVITKYRDSATGPFPATWANVGTIVSAGSPSAVLSPTTGRTELVYRGNDGKVYSTGETAPGSGTWRAEKLAYDGIAATDPTAFGYTNVSGRWAVVFRDQDRPIALTVDEL